MTFLIGSSMTYSLTVSASSTVRHYLRLPDAPFCGLSILHLNLTTILLIVVDEGERYAIDIVLAKLSLCYHINLNNFDFFQCRIAT